MQVSFKLTDQIFNHCVFFYSHINSSEKKCCNILLFKCIMFFSISLVFLQTFHNFVLDRVKISIPRQYLFDGYYLFLKQIDVDTYFQSCVIKCYNPCIFCVPWFRAAVIDYLIDYLCVTSATKLFFVIKQRLMCN